MEKLFQLKTKSVIWRDNKLFSPNVKVPKQDVSNRDKNYIYLKDPVLI